MSATKKKVQCTSSPMAIPRGLQKRKRSILKNSLDSDYSGTPDATGSSHNSRSGVRFNDDNIESPDYFLYDSSKISGGQTIISPMVAFSKISADKSLHHHSNHRNGHSNDDNDSLNGEEGSDDEGSDDEFERPSSVLSDETSPSTSVHFSTSMSAEAQYAVLKAYEDELHERLSQTFPQLAHRLKETRSRSPEVLETGISDSAHAQNHEPEAEIDHVSDHVTLDDHVSLVSSVRCPNKVANRLQTAMDILDSVREASGEELAMGSSHSRSIAKDPVRSFEKWCGSLREALNDLQ